MSVQGLIQSGQNYGTYEMAAPRFYQEPRADKKLAFLSVRGWPQASFDFDVALWGRCPL